MRYTLQGEWTEERFFQLHGRGTVEISLQPAGNALILLADGTFMSNGENKFKLETWNLLDPERPA